MKVAVSGVVCLQDIMTASTASIMTASTVQLFSLGDSRAYREGKMLSQISAVSGSEQ